MKKFSILTDVKGVLFLQEFAASPEAWGSLGVRGHIGIDISRGDEDELPAYYAGTVVYASEGTVVYLTDEDQDGQCLEVTVGHMKDVRVKVKDRVKPGTILGLQSTEGTSVAWVPGSVDKVAWSHEHLSIRIAKRGKLEQKLKWDYQAFSPISYHIEEYDVAVDHFRDPNLWNIQIIDDFIKAIATHEGFFSGKSRIAVECNNPGNIRYSPLADGYRDYGTIAKPNIFAVFSTLEKGWAALRRDVEIKATGRSKHMKATESILKFFEVYAPGRDNNDPRAYAEAVLKNVGLKTLDHPISDVMLTEFEYLRKYNDFSAGWFVKAEKHGPQVANLFKSFRYLWNSFFKGR